MNIFITRYLIILNYLFICLIVCFFRGLLSGHILAEYLQQRADIMPWYRGELLDLAKDLGYRFLPAFNTTTGIPYGRVSLIYNMQCFVQVLTLKLCLSIHKIYVKLHLNLNSAFIFVIKTYFR